MSFTAKPTVVIAGQTPPPTGGQNVMIARLLEELRRDERWSLEHLEFCFTPSFSTVRQAKFSKVWELLKVSGRLWRLFDRVLGPEPRCRIVLVEVSCTHQAPPVFRHGANFR